MAFISGDRVQVEYDALEEIATRFRREADEVDWLRRRVSWRVSDLENGGWIGRGAKAFFDEMNMEILPALNRLVEALYDAEDTTRRISRIMQDAEEEAARLFR
jgi:WXG100 family type VII secretion target